MSANKKAFKRYLIIDEMLRKRPGIYVSIEDIINNVQEILGDSISERTIKGDLEFMKTDSSIQAPISNKRGLGYYYTNSKFRFKASSLSDQDLQSIRQTISLLKNYSQLGLPASFSSAVNKLDLVMADTDETSVLLLDQTDSYRGARHLEILYNAIQNKEAIRFQYKKFDAPSKAEKFLVRSPLVLKEYQRMWYVLMYHLEEDTFRNYALDRMSFVGVEPNAIYTKPKNFSPQKYYQYAMGITVDNKRKPDLIKLKVFKPLLHYIQELPWHTTQEIVLIDANSAIVTLKVYVGSELLKELLSWGPSVEVLEPISLREKIAEQVKGLLSLYGK